MAYEKGFDHKSLEQISIKNLVDDPVGLTEDVTLTSGLWFCNQVLPRRGNGYSRYLIEILAWGYTRDSPRHLCQPHIHQWWEEMRLSTRNQGRPSAKCPCRHDHCWMARWYQGCSKSMTRRSNHCSPRREEGLGTDPSGTLRHIKVPVQGKTVCVLAWHQRHQTIEACTTCQKHWPK